MTIKRWLGQSFRLYGRQVRRQSFLPEKSGRVLQKITTHYPLRQNSTATMSCKEVSVMSDDEVISWFSSFDTVMTDCDGVLWTGGAALDGSPDMICRFRDMGKKVFYVTNNSTKHRREYKTKLDKLGFGGEMDEIIATAYLAASYLEDTGFDKSKSVYVVGSTGITQELDDLGIKHNDVGPEPLPDGMTLENIRQKLPPKEEGVGAVIVGFDIHISFMKMMRGASYLSDKQIQFIATNTDEQFPMKAQGLVVPGTGSMVAAVETCAGRKPIVLGKPSKFMFDIVKNRHPSIEPSRTLMIGDRANTDILLGKNCGLQTLLVGSGVHSLQEARKWQASDDVEERRLVADFYVDKLGDLFERVKDLVPL